MISIFYRDVLPSEGNYCLWDKTTKQHTWFSSQEELLSFTEELIENEAQGVYFATAAFNDVAVANGNKDARTQANVTGKKCFYLDLDAGAKKLAKHGEDKVYATQKDAIADARRFVQATDLSPTYLISSGEGLHLYWVLDESVSGAEWTPVAKRLSKLFKQHGLKEDSAVTSDSARILRPIGTVHENGTNVKPLLRRGPTYSFEEFKAILTNMLVDDGDDEDEFDFDVPRGKYDTAVNEDVIVEGPPKSVRKIAPKCGALAEVIRKRGNVEEPYWRAMLGIVKHTVEGDKAAHAFSSGHPDYDKRDTQFKLDNWKTGPTTCAEFAKHCSECGKCEHRGTIKSPIQLGLMTDKEVEKLPEEKRPAPKPPEPTGAPWDGYIPAGFSVTTTGTVNTLMYRMPIQREDEETGDVITIYVQVPITSDIFWFSQWSDAEDGDTAQVFLQKWTGKRVVSFTLDQTLIANQQKLREYLAGKSIILASHKNTPKALEEYVKMQIASIKEIGEMPRISKRLGIFITEEGNLNCAHGQYIIDHKGTIRRGILSNEIEGIAKGFVIPLPHNNGVEWDASVWDEHLIPKAKQHADFLRRHYQKPGLEKFQLAAMMMLSSPLMPFVTAEYVSGRALPNNCGMSLSLFSAEGGRGKTTLMKSAALAFGLPNASVADRNKTGTTTAGRGARLEIMGTMPIGMDEMGQGEDAQAVAAACAEAVSIVANGVNKERATKDGGVRIGQTFSLISVMGTNKSARDMINAASAETNAIQFRLLELDVDNIREFDREARAEFIKDWNEVMHCAGAMGAVLHREICKHSVVGLNKLVSAAVNKASDILESKQTDRFQYRGLGAMLTAYSLLRNVGIELFDLQTLVKTFKDSHSLGASYAYENTLPSDGLSLLNMALHELTPYTAVTQDETRRSKHITKYDEPLVPVPPTVKARHVVSSRLTYVSSVALRDWCINRKVSFSKMMHAARENNVMTSIYAKGKPGHAEMFNLLKGMRGSTESSVSCYVFDINKLAMETGRDYTAAALRELTAENVIKLPGSSQPEVIENEAKPRTAG